MAELHYIQFSEHPFLYSPVSSAFLLRLGDGHLPSTTASDLMLSKKTLPFRRDVYSHPTLHSLVCSVCKYLKTFRAGKKPLPA